MKKWRVSKLFRSIPGLGVQPIGLNTLTGYFELRADRVVGWVRDTYGLQPRVTMQIEIRGQGGVITSGPAICDPAHRLFRFSLPVNGRFTGTELVREEVYITARTSDGNTGRLLLDGAAQLALIRDYLDIPNTMLADLHFSLDGNAIPFLGTGWSRPEPNVTWTENTDSFVYFEVPFEPGEYALRMTAGAFISKPEVPTQDLVVFMNDTYVTRLVYSDALVQFQECKFTHEVFAGTTHATLRLHHPDARRPFDLGLSKDMRQLAFAFKRLTLVRLLQCE